MDRVADPCERVSCPFDPVHVIERSKLQKHIVKCKKNLPSNHDFVECQFWGNHYVKKSQLEAHYQTCEHALMKQATKRACDFEPSRFKEPKLIYNNVPASSNDDSWDTPYDQQIFRPELLKAQASTMMIPTGLPKSKRKEFREQERKRIRELEESQKLDKFSQFEKNWNTDSALDSQQNLRKPNTSAVHMYDYGSSTGTSHDDDSFGGASTSHSTNTNSSGSVRNTVHQQSTHVPAISNVAPGYASQSEMRMPVRGRGRALLSAWDNGARPSHHPHPYDGIPYRYAPDDFPNL